MQNRNMFLYRRQGSKNRAKTGSSRKNRGPQKGLPTSARDLLPLIQPATKALAQMLAGRTAASGQLGHARAILAQTERLLADRSHNRLNPVEREEFFEQVARLRLTLSDAENEAEVQATEHQTPKSAPIPIDRERLKEMALALTGSSGSTSYEQRHGTPSSAPDEVAEDSPSHADSDDDDNDDDDNEVLTQSPLADDGITEAKRRAQEDPSRLRLPHHVASRVTIRPESVRIETGNGRQRQRRAKSASPSPATAATSSGEATSERDQSAGAATSTDRDQSGQKLPKGWIIDEEGFVVPGST